jgi:hypothetical protein
VNALEIDAESLVKKEAVLHCSRDRQFIYHLIQVSYIQTQELGVLVYLVTVLYQCEL